MKTRDKSVISSNLVYHNKQKKIKAVFWTNDHVASVAYLVKYTKKRI